MAGNKNSGRKKGKAPETKTVSGRLDLDTYAKLEALAEKNHRAISNMVAVILTDFFKQEEGG